MTGKMWRGNDDGKKKIKRDDTKKEEDGKNRKEEKGREDNNEQIKIRICTLSFVQTKPDTNPTSFLRYCDPNESEQPNRPEVISCPSHSEL